MRRIKTYLSIDLDYWRYRKDPQPCTTFFQQVWGLQLPIYVVMYHHHLLPHINAHDCDILINVDYHSDLADLEPGRILDFNEGTWANFVDWRCVGRFIWRYPASECLSGGTGYCHSNHNPFLERGVASWKCVQKRVGLWGIPWKHITAVGVSVSPDWIGPAETLAEPIRQLHIGRWIADFNRARDHAQSPRRHQPKFVRV